LSGLSIRPDQPKPGFAILRLSGEFEGMTVQESKEALFSHFKAPGTKEVILDFGDISYVDSSGIGVLIEMAKTAQQSKVRFGLINVMDPVRSVIVMTKVDKIIPIY
jgi:anti-anti-sigma factor